uniref:Uncharacterized protein n=1 Tax=Anguilla anguilla TaxID=7936 RepID=A0A0E9W556_ANGAN
MWHKVHEQK